MDVHCSLNHRVWCARIHDVGDAVNHFVTADSQDRRAEYGFVIGIHKDLHKALCFATLASPADPCHHHLANQHVAPYYLERSLVETGVPNVVTAVLASYRGYDTLGELTVIFTAGIGVLLLLGRRREKAVTRPEAGDGGS